MGKRKFSDKIKKLGKKYDQDAVLIQKKKTGTFSATRKGGLDKAKRVRAGTMKPGRTSAQGDTKIKGKTFTYEQTL